MITYYCDDVRYPRLKNPDAWVKVNDDSAAMFQSYPFFEHAPINGSPDPVRYGDFVIDIDTGDIACEAALKILAWMAEIYGIEEDAWRIYLSGKKGVHLELPSVVCGLDTGHVLLPMAYKRLALDIQGELGVMLDLSMYNKGTGKPYRRVNIMRDIGTCKRQIEIEDLESITDHDDYISACCEPGPVWEPGGRYLIRNDLLADKLAYYLDEASTAPDTKPLTDVQINVLNAMSPPCIEILRNATDIICGATFNDVAIQLSAYCISTGKPEDSFLRGCKAFIDGYPSSSLNTLEKRYSNATARYRTMAVNGYAHSCGGIQSILHDKQLCNGCPFKSVAPVDLISVMTPEDFASDSTSLIIPASAIPDGLIKEGMEALGGDIEQYTLPLVLTVLSRAIAGKICLNGVHPNIFNIKVGGTSTGKSAADKIFKDNLSIDRFICVNDIASGPGLLRAVAENPKGMGLFDEVSSIFSRMSGKPDNVGDGKSYALLELYSIAGQQYTKSFGDKNNNISINNSCFSLIGNATPTIFDDIKIKDFETGLMQRFDFWCYDGPILPKPLLDKNSTANVMAFQQKLSNIMMTSITDNSTKNLGAIIREYREIGFDNIARATMQEYSAYVVDEGNKADTPGETGFISRRFDLALKYALIHRAGQASDDPAVIFEPATREDVDYGIMIAELIGGWKSNILAGKVTSGDFHKDCETFKDAIKIATKSGRHGPTFSFLASRKTALKNWQTKYSEEIIKVLTKRGEIITKEGSRSTKYFLTKNAEDG